MGIKQLDEKSFDKLWKVMSNEQFERQIELITEKTNNMNGGETNLQSPDVDFDY